MRDSSRVISVLGGYGIFGGRIAEAAGLRLAALSRASRRPKSETGGQLRTEDRGRISCMR